VEGLRPNARGPGLVTFGPDRVRKFCETNDLQMIVRAHECVMDGFERFAQGRLITVFSAGHHTPFTFLSFLNWCSMVQVVWSIAHQHQLGLFVNTRTHVHAHTLTHTPNG
jgi:hypothetical protein